MVRYSQRDPQWAEIALGFTNNTTIGSHGCTITCIAMLAGITPAEVNERLKSVNGYAAPKKDPSQKNLIIWAKVEEAIPWLKFEWRGYSYENDRVKAAIEKNGACLVAVNGSQIGGSTKDGHWINFIGNKKAIDPWTGQEISTSQYPTTGYAIINKTGEPPMAEGCLLPNTEENRKKYEELVTKASWYDANHDRCSNLDEANKSLHEEIQNLEENIREATPLEETTEYLELQKLNQDYKRQFGVLANALFVGENEPPLNAEHERIFFETPTEDLVMDAAEALHDRASEIYDHTPPQMTIGGLWDSVPNPIKVALYVSVSAGIAEAINFLTGLGANSLILTGLVNVGIVSLKELAKQISTLRDNLAD